MDKLVSYIGVILAIVGLIFAAGQKLGQLENRIKTLEDSQHYYHGEQVEARK